MKTLIVYRATPNGTEIAWQAPFKDNESLLLAIQDYSSRGFFCKVS